MLIGKFSPKREIDGFSNPYIAHLPDEVSWIACYRDMDNAVIVCFPLDSLGVPV